MSKKPKKRWFTFDELRAEALRRGCGARECSTWHWQVRHENRMLNYWPNTGNLNFEGYRKEPGVKVWTAAGVVDVALREPTGQPTTSKGAANWQDKEQSH